MNRGADIYSCYAIALPGRKSVFRAGFWPDCYRESTDIGLPAVLRPAGGPISVFSRLQSGQIRPGRLIYGPEFKDRVGTWNRDRGADSYVMCIAQCQQASPASSNKDLGDVEEP